MKRFDPTTWIDDQRAAGRARQNVFAAILSESARVRLERQCRSAGGDDRRREQVERIRSAAREHDEAIGVVPMFAEL